MSTTGTHGTHGTHGITVATGSNDPAKPALQRVCAGEALLLTEADIDLVDLVNQSQDIYEELLDDDVDPDDYRLAEVLLEHLVYVYGVERHGEGDRIRDVETHLRRYLFPFAVETTAAQLAPGREGVAHHRLKHLQHLPRILSGDRPLPAATVAGDQLNRRGIACIWLSLDDAAAVIDGGRRALTDAIDAGSLPVHAEARTGAPVVMALHLRLAGLLHEPPTPHGLAKNTATDVLRLMNQTLARARTHGADIRFALKLKAIEPLASRRVRPVKQPSGYTPVSTIYTVNAHLPVIGQVVLWVARLTGARIGEVYGLQVCDYVRDTEGRPWLTITKQGGTRSQGRDANGRLVAQDSKDHTKTDSGQRTIPIPGLLGELLDRLIQVFHTDAVSGQAQLTNRLIPGVGKDDASGQSSLRRWLDRALGASAARRFTMHDLRDALITDLKNAGIDARLAHYFAGHEQPNATIQDRHYDLGPNSELLQPVADVMAAILVGESVADLRVPTAVREQWGTDTRAYRRADEIEEALVAQGWRTDGQDAPGGRLLSVKEVADRIGKAESYTRRLMSSGTIPAHTESWGKRPVWVAHERDIDACVRSMTRPGIDDLAAEIGWTYHQVFHVLRELELVPAEHQKGHQLRLDAGAVEAFRVEAARRRQVLETAVSLAQAAETLDMPVTSVETLVGQGMLELTDGPTDARRRWVTVSSVEAYRARFPTQQPAVHADDEPLLTNAETRRILGLTRNEVTRLTSIRQLTLAKRPGSRHMYVTVTSALAYARRVGRPAAAVKELEARLRSVHEVGG